MAKNRRIAKFICWSVLAGVLSSLASTTVAGAGDVGTLSWYYSYEAAGRYADNQTVTGKKRFILMDYAIGGYVGNYGYLKWCVSLNGQPLSMSEKAGQGLDNETTMYLMFEQAGILSQNAQSELGCWVVASADLQYSSDGIDLTINTASWPDGLHTLTFTGYHKTGVVGTKSININTVNSTSQVKISSSSGTVSGSTKLSVNYSRMNRASNICLRRNSAPVDSSFKFLGASPDANGCWPIVDTGTTIIGSAASSSNYFERLSGTRTAEFTVDTLNWVDGAQTIDAVVPHVYPEIGSGSAAFTSLNPALGLNVSGLTDGEQVNGIRTVSTASVINAVHTSQIQTATYCIDFDGQQCLYSLKSSSNSAAFDIDPRKYVDGPHSLKFRVTDSAGREASKTVAIQISYGKPIVTGVKVSTTKPASVNGTASATIEFKISGSFVASVSVSAGKGNASQEVDMLSSFSGVTSATFESLKPATKFTYQIKAGNPNGQSKTVTGKFTTPAAPKPVPRVDSGQSSGSGYGTSVIGWRLDRALAALGWSKNYQATEALWCPGKQTWFGIVDPSNWIVVDQTSSMLYACKFR